MSAPANSLPTVPDVPSAGLRVRVAAGALLALGLLAAGWWLGRGVAPAGRAQPAPNGPVGVGVFRPYRIPGGALHTGGFVKTEELRQESGSWLGTTSAGLRVEATYRYEIVLRSDWRFLVDEQRKVAFVLAPMYRPQLPVAFATAATQEWTSSGWGRFDKWPQLQALRQQVSPFLERQAGSADYLALAREEARAVVEQYVGDWLRRTEGWRPADRPLVKAFFVGESDIPFPAGAARETFEPEYR